jgi:hypothetical protein
VLPRHRMSRQRPGIREELDQTPQVTPLVPYLPV